MKKYLFTIATPNGDFHAILKDVEIRDGAVSGTVIGRFIGYNDKGEPLYEEAPSREYHAGGSAWVMVEIPENTLQKVLE